MNTRLAQKLRSLARSLRRRLKEPLAGPRQPRVIAAIQDVQKRNLTYLETEALRDLAGVAEANERRGLAGQIIETGCAAGGSAIVLASAKNPQRPMRVYDVFGLIPPPSDRDGSDVQERYKQILDGKAVGPNDSPYYGYQSDLHDQVVASFESFGLDLAENRVELIRGLYQDTLHVTEPVALAHIDCDWYDSVLLCLEQIEPHVVPGGTLVIDDYDAWSGCRQAVDDYFRDRATGSYRFVPRSRLHIIKMR